MRPCDETKNGAWHKSSGADASACRAEQARPSQPSATPCLLIRSHHFPCRRIRKPSSSTRHHCDLALKLFKLSQTEEIAFAISKPGSFVWSYCRDTVDGRGRRQIVLFKDDPTSFESSYFRLDILNQPHRLGVGPAGLTLRGEDRESAVSATAVQKTSW